MGRRHLACLANLSLGDRSLVLITCSAIVSELDLVRGPIIHIMSFDQKWHLNRQTFEIVDLVLSRNEPEISVVVPVFNQESIIVRNLRGLMESMTLSWELIIIDDASSDDSLYLIREWGEFLAAKEAPTSQKGSLTRLRIFSNKKSLYETRCDAIGMGVAAADWVLEVQADMLMQEEGFDAKLVMALVKNDDLLMISGRGTEPLLPIVDQYVDTLGSDRSSTNSWAQYLGSRVIRQLRSLVREIFKNQSRENSKSKASPRATLDELCPPREVFEATGTAGRVGELIETDIPPQFRDQQRIWIGETVMRGPLLISKKKFLEVGGLDTDHFFQGFDDHDLAARARMSKGYGVGFLPVEFHSPIADGTTRQRRSLSSEIQIFRELLRIQPGRKNTALAQIHADRALFSALPEIRELS